MRAVYWEKVSLFFSGNALSVTRPAAMKPISPWRRYLMAPRGLEDRSKDQSNSSHRRCRQSPRNSKWEARCVLKHQEYENMKTIEIAQFIVVEIYIFTSLELYEKNTFRMLNHSDHLILTGSKICMKPSWLIFKFFSCCLHLKLHITI